MRFSNRIADRQHGHIGIIVTLVQAVAALMLAATVPATAATADTISLKVELNKLEQQDTSCRAYVVVTNAGQTAYKALKLDLVMFRPDGVIGKRFAIDLAPIKPEKRTVKLFNIEGTPCDQVGSLLINDVMECSSEAGTVDNCLAQISTSSLANVQLSK